ncbi:MAG: hypothetical protein EU547_06735 [Promethearchaeota archaeon]|nr:MAG: hypothetical protein EU547_06735 [Candidatus Lokiarchaeota archaeon]
MSYIEKKYFQKIIEIFDNLKKSDKTLLDLIKQKSLKKADDISTELASVNRNLNLILGKYYPEIKDLNDKLKIKSIMKFYYDLLDKFTDFLRHVENFNRLDDRYYDSIITFIHDKESLINNKYRRIVSQELMNFYDQKSRENLERILASKMESKNREFFTIGSLEEEIKKIAKINGATKIVFNKPEKKHRSEMKDAKTVISYNCKDENKIDDKIAIILKNFLKSKNYEVIINKNSELITNVKLLN